MEPMAADGRAPAERFRLADGTTFGIIASVTAPFCRTCDRSRITADGTWFLCLYAGAGIDLREPLRRGAPDDELASLIRETRSEEHTSELQSPCNLVCRLLLEKKKRSAAVRRP